MNTYNAAKRLIGLLVENGAEADDYLTRSGIAKPSRPMPGPPPPPEPTRRERELAQKGNYLDPEEDDDADELLQNYIDVEHLRFEGESGVRDLEQLVGVIGYPSLEEFLADNPGACEAIISFIEEWVPKTVNHHDSWYDKLRDALGR